MLCLRQVRDLCVKKTHTHTLTPHRPLARAGVSTFTLRARCRQQTYQMRLITRTASFSARQQLTSAEHKRYYAGTEFSAVYLFVRLWRDTHNCNCARQRMCGTCSPRSKRGSSLVETHACCTANQSGVCVQLQRAASRPVSQTLHIARTQRVDRRRDTSLGIIRLLVCDRAAATWIIYDVTIRRFVCQPVPHTQRMCSTHEQINRRVFFARALRNQFSRCAVA